MTYKSIDALLDASVVAAQQPKAPMPTTGPRGEPHIPEKLLPGELAAMAVIHDAKRDDPLFGNPCSVRGCRDVPQYSWGGGPLNGNLEELLRQPEIHNEDPLTARIEAAVQRARPAVQVPTTPVFYLCGRHFQEFQDRRVERVNARRAAATEPSWPLWEMNREGATVEIEPPYVFITESPENGGRRLRYDFARYADVKAWLEGKRVVYEVLTSKQIGDLKYRLSRAPQAPDPTEPGRYWAEQAQRLF